MAQLARGLLENVALALDHHGPGKASLLEKRERENVSVYTEQCLRLPSSTFNFPTIQSHESVATILTL